MDLPVRRRLLVNSSLRRPRPATHTPCRYTSICTSIWDAAEAALESRPTQGTPRCQLQLSEEDGRCSWPAFGGLLRCRGDRQLLRWADWLRVTSAPNLVICPEIG